MGVESAQVWGSKGMLSPVELRRLFVGILLLVSSSGALAASEPVKFRLLKLNGDHVKWGEPVLGTPAVVTYAFASRRVDDAEAFNCKSIEPLDGLLTRSDIPIGAFTESVRAAFQVWERAAGITFRPALEREPADILIGVQVTPRGIAFTNLALKDGAGRIRSISRATICLNPVRRWEIGLDGNSATYNVTYVVAHEIGHAIGLDHFGRSGALMGFAYDDSAVTLRAGDARGAAHLYGPSPSPTP